MGCDRALGGGVAATPLLHTGNGGNSRDRGVATPWSATAGDVASVPLSVSQKGGFAKGWLWRMCPYALPPPFWGHY